MKMILTGTTGHLGSRVLTSILKDHLIPASDLIISSSNADKVPAIAREHNVEIRPGDYTDPSSLITSFAGADVLFLVSFPTPSIERWLNHRNAIDAAREAGVKTIIYSSLMFGGETGMYSIAGVQQAHIKTVEYLHGCGLEYLVIREGIYAEGWWLYAGFQPQTFQKKEDDDPDSQVPLEWVIPNDGPVAWVSWDDLGEGTARILADYKKYVGKTLRLTGKKAITISEIAAIVERETGRTVNLKIVGKGEAARFHKERKSMPESRFAFIDSWSGWHDAIAKGETMVVDPLLEELIGREPKGIEEMAGEMFKAV